VASKWCRSYHVEPCTVHTRLGAASISLDTVPLVRTRSVPSPNFGYKDTQTKHLETVFYQHCLISPKNKAGTSIVDDRGVMSDETLIADVTIMAAGRGVVWRDKTLNYLKDQSGNLES
jgi:hypothetical protein